ncbi:hypothetical protein VNO77_02821 [Canavalia gladiata]|uniref:Uncharacterized protein n=1 Tax=Canavalia gladiata TaxID=3824 RepID=A0AAN9MVQ8_CANGL
MALRQGYSFGKNRGERSCFPVLGFIQLCVLAHVVFFLGRGLYAVDQDYISFVPSKQEYYFKAGHAPLMKVLAQYGS